VVLDNSCSQILLLFCVECLAWKFDCSKLDKYPPGSYSFFPPLLFSPLHSPTHSPFLPISLLALVPLLELVGSPPFLETELGWRFWKSETLASEKLRDVPATGEVGEVEEVGEVGVSAGVRGLRGDPIDLLELERGAVGGLALVVELGVAVAVAEVETLGVVKGCVGEVGVDGVALGGKEERGDAAEMVWL
jgi:hypothetical protein